MRRSLFITLLSIGILFLSSCDTANEPPTLPVAFKTEPSDEMRVMVKETPSDFTLSFFEDNIFISLQSEVDWEGEMVLSGFQLLNGEVVDRITTNPVQLNADELLTDVPSEVLFPSDFAPIQWAESSKWESMSNSFRKKWENASVQDPVSIWEPEKK